MKVRQKYQCSACGIVLPIEEAFTPPTDTEKAQPKPCPRCGARAWESAR